MRTHEDALAHITEAIEATGVVENAAAEYDLDAIADDLYSAAGGTWQIDDLDTGIFWWVVQRHARDDDKTTTPAPQDVSAGTDEILSALTDAGERVSQVREDLRAAEAERDALVVRAARTGAATQAQIARLAGVTRARAGQIINR